MKQLTRRRMLALLGVGAAGATGAGLMLGYNLQRLRSFARRATAITRPDDPPGAVSRATMDVLVALPAALVDRDLPPDHYIEFFQFRASTLRGYRTLYEDFARDVTDAARGLGHESFLDASRADQRSALLAIGLTPEPMPLDLVFTRRQPVRYDRYIIREVLQHFNYTHGWMLAGYGTWPGQPRSLEHYQAPIPDPEPNA